MSTRTYSPWLSVVLRLVLVMALFSLSRIIFYALNTALFPGLSGSELAVVLKGGVKFDFAAVLYLNLLYILIGISPWAGKNVVEKIANGLFVFTNAVGLLLNCIDTAYYAFNLKRMTFTSLGEVQGFNNAGDLLISFLFRYGYVWLLFAAFVYALVKIKNNIKVTKDAFPWYGFMAGYVAAVGIIFFGVRGDWKHSTRPLGLNHAGEYVKSPQNVALVYSTPFSIIRTINERKLKPYTYFTDEKALEEIYNPVQNVGNGEPFRPMNVVVIVLESFTDAASSVANPKMGQYMPFVDSLRRASFYSEYSFANGKKSIEALPAIWGSIPSYMQPYVLSKYSSNTIYGLPKILKDKGYHTSFFHGAPNGSMGFQSFSNLMGIDHYYGKNEYNNDKDFDGIWGVWDQPFMKYFGKTLKTLPQPFMSTVFTVSSHDPFKVPEGQEKAYPEGPHPLFKTFAYTDKAVRMFFEEIKNEPWFNNTLFVFSADHTNAAALTDDFNTSVGNFRIPIFFYAPGLNLAYKSDKVFQQIDIMPTVLSILQYEKPFISFGKNLLDPQAKSFAVNRYENYQYIYGDLLLKLDAENGIAGLYRYTNDKNLEKDLKAVLPDSAQLLHTHFKGYIQQFQNRMIEDRFIVK